MDGIEIASEVKGFDEAAQCLFNVQFSPPVKHSLTSIALSLNLHGVETTTSVVRVMNKLKK